MDWRSQVVRLLLLLVLAAGIATDARAGGSPLVGVHVGGDRAGIDGDSPPSASYVPKFGLVAGVQAEFGLAGDLSLSLQPSFVRVRTGIQSAASTGGGEPVEVDLSLDYVSLPILVKFAQGGGRTYVAGGLAVDFLSGANLSGAASDRDVSSAYEDTALGAVLGFGVVFPAGRTRITTELRFVQGITNLTTGDIAEATGALAPRLHSSGLQLLVGGLFPIGGR